MKPIIKVDRITKNFHYWADRPGTVKTILVQGLSGKISFGKKNIFCALENVSFEIHSGEFVGIMGKNGAGKSTILKLICGIYSPTSGQIQVKEAIAPLIELGAGFDGDLSGYENIFLNAAILGFGRAATLQALPHILEFSELGDKIHMQVKKYSSGMLVRLGFSIATHLTAPIILIDEVLAVGDTGFQEKCLKKIKALHQSGRTIVLVTHDPRSIKTHCNRCIVIAERHKIFDGSPSTGVNYYLRAVGQA